MAQVDQFMAENEERLRGMYGYPQLKKDVTAYGSNLKVELANNMIAKHILNNRYGNPCNGEIALLFKKYCIQNTQFVGGSYEDAR